MLARSDGTGREQNHARRMQKRAEAELLEDGGEQRGLLEAITAAPATDELFLEMPQIQKYRTAEQDVEILERNTRHVRMQEPCQRIERAAQAAGPADAVEISIEIER